jgi:HK97 family phage major capsid protein
MRIVSAVAVAVPESDKHSRNIKHNGDIMSWQIEKGLKEKKAQAAAKIEQAGKILSAANGEISAEDKATFDALHAEAKEINENVARIESQMQAEKMCFAQKLDLPIDKPKTAERYSFLKALREMSDLSHPGLSGLEKECSDEISRQTNKSPRGFFMPTSLPTYERNTLDTTAGAGAIQTTVDAANWIEILRNRMVLKQLGVTFIGDLVGNLALPKQTAQANAYWVSDGNAPTAGAPAIGQVVFTPKICGGYTDLSRNFLKQSSLDAEMFARTDLAKSVAHELDRVGLNGSGANAQPLGILQNSNVTVVPLGTNGGAPTWTSIVGLEAAVAEKNADIGPGAYVASPGVRGTMKVTPKTSAGYPVFLWEDEEVNGYPALATNAMPNNLTKGYGTGLGSIIFGIWETLCIGMWGGLDVLVDPYTGSSAGTVRIVTLADVDVELRYNEAFAVSTDIVTSM